MGHEQDHAGERARRVHPDWSINEVREMVKAGSWSRRSTTTRCWPSADTRAGLTANFRRRDFKEVLGVDLIFRNDSVARAKSPSAVSKEHTRPEHGG